MKKSQIIETLANFPEELDLNEFLNKLIVMQKVEEAEEDIVQGRVHSLDEVEQFFKERWSK